MSCRWHSVCLILCTLGPLGTGLAAAHDRITCSDLALAQIPDTTITLALNPATANPMAPEHCEVIGRIKERTGIDGKP